MSHRHEKRVRRAARAAVLTAVSLDAFCLGVPRLALAQTASGSQTTDKTAANPNDLQEVVVTGFRASLQTALDTKRASNLPIESVAARKISARCRTRTSPSPCSVCPACRSIASMGQGTQVLIDGLRQNLVTLNGESFLTGKEFYVSGEASGGGAGSNSQYNSLETIPTEEISGIDVYKNPNAVITEGGLGGTINLKTRDPLAQPAGFSIAANLRASRAQQQGDTTPAGTLVASFRPSDRLGITASVSYDDIKTHTDEFQDQNRNQWLITNSATGPYTGPLQPGDLSTLPKYYIEPQLAYFTDVLDQRKTTGATLGFSPEDHGLDHHQPQLVLHARARDHDRLHRQGLVQRPGFAAPGSFLPGHRSDAELLDRRQRCGSERRVQRQRRRNCDAIPRKYFAGEQFPVGDPVQQRRPTPRRFHRLVLQGNLRPAGRPGRRRTRPVQRVPKRYAHIPHCAGLQQRRFDLRYWQPWLRVRVVERRFLRTAQGQLPSALCGRFDQPRLHDFQVQLGVGQQHHAEDRSGKVRSELGPGLHAGCCRYDLGRRALRQA